MKYLLAFILLISTTVSGQTRIKDSALGFQKADKILRIHPVYPFYGEPVSLIIETRTERSDDGLFYFFLGLILYVALIRIIFYKYVSTLFTLFFRATLRQQQLREQLLQFPLPALLMNIFFIISTSTYFTLLGAYYHLPAANHFWFMLMWTMGVVAVIYVGKYILLSMAGWIFGIRNTADAYIFAVFLVNKMIGMFLLPVIILLAFSSAELKPAVVVVSYVLLAGMMLYRFIISYRPVRMEIKLNRLHFFLYLCAFEIAPLLLIYKVLLSNVLADYK